MHIPRLQCIHALHLPGGFKFDPPGSTRCWWCLLSECGVVGAQVRLVLVLSVALHGLGVGGEAALSVGCAGGSSSGLSDGGVTTGGTCILALKGGMQVCSYLCSCSMSHVVTVVV